MRYLFEKKKIEFIVLFEKESVLANNTDTSRHHVFLYQQAPQPS